jgi:hypothetical protein
LGVGEGFASPEEAAALGAAGVLDGVESADVAAGFESLAAVPSVAVAAVLPLAESFEARESVMYQPLPLKTIPTG